MSFLRFSNHILWIFLGFLWITGLNAQPLPNFSVQVSAETQAIPPQIKLKWPAVNSSIVYGIMRKGKDDPVWPNNFIATLPGSATSFTDNTVNVGQGYEYLILRNFTNAGDTLVGLGYIYSGIELPAVEDRGILILVLDTTHEASLQFEINRLENDLIGDGWRIRKIRVDRTDAPPSVRSKIQTIYQENPSETKAVFLLGRVPVPYSGDLNPDAHADHKGAWPADVYYGEMNSVWTDVTVNNTTATRNENKNAPGDGKFDQSVIPSDIELWVGRVDLANMPAFGLPEVELLRRYLDKHHKFRNGQLTAVRRALMDANFGAMDGPVTHFIANGLRNFSPFFGPDSIKNLDWFSTLNNNSYLWAYGYGPGSYTSASGVGNTTQFASTPVQAVFTLLFGSYFGDWDSNNNFLRAPLASNTHALTCAWAGRPYWPLHHMAMGEPIGFNARLAQNNGNVTHPIIPFVYDPAAFPRRVHIALMGDPTLRMHIVPPPSNLVVSATNNNRYSSLNWQASTDPNVLGYYVYRYDTAQKKYIRISHTLVTGTTFLDTLPDPGQNLYMVRAYKLEESASGTYYNLSQGIFGNVFLPLVIHLQVAKNQFCLPDTSTITVTASGPFRNNNQFSIQLSDQTGNFSSPTVLGVMANSVGGTASFQLSSSLISSSGYRIRVVASNAPFIGDTSNALNLIKVPLPVAASNSPVCVGGTLELTASPIANAQYKWSGPANFSSTLQNPTITGANLSIAGVYSVAAIIQQCTSEWATVGAVIQNIAPPIFSSNAPLCVGDTLKLAAAPIAGASYKFWGPNNFSETTPSPSTFIANVSQLNAGVYTVEALVPGCAPTSQTLTVTVKNKPPAPTISMNAPLCEGENLILTAPLFSLATYLWSGPANFSGSSGNTVSISNINASHSGIYSLNVVIDGCTSALGVKEAVIAPQPLAPSLTSYSVCQGQSITLSTPTPANGFLWNVPGASPSATSSPSFTLVNALAANAGLVSLNAIINGCTSLTASAALNVIPLPQQPLVTAPATLCQGQNFFIQINGNADSYYLTGPQGWNVSGAGPSFEIMDVSASHAGNYSAIAIAGGCSSAATNFSLQVVSLPAAPVFNSTYAFCENSHLSIALSPLANSGFYVWQGPNGFQANSPSTLVRPNAALSYAGAYQAIAVVNGCSSQSASTQVQIFQQPVLGAVIGTAEACVGETVVLSTPPHSYSLFWQGPLGFQSVQDSPAIVMQTVNNGGVYTVVAIANGCTSLSVTHTITVKPLPPTPQIVGNVNYCQGQALTLSAVASGVDSYYWTLPGGAGETQNPLVILGLTTSQSGNYSVRAIANGCTSLVASKSIMVYPIPSALPIQGIEEICTGKTLSLSASAISGATYLWSGPGGFHHASQSPSFARVNIQLTDSGLYSLKVVVNGCTSDASFHSILVKATPEIPVLNGNTNLCEGSSLILFTEPSEGLDYLWQGGGVAGPNLSSWVLPNISSSQSGTYTLRVVQNGCTSGVAQKNVLVRSKPVLDPPLFPSQVCAGQNSQFVAQPMVSGTQYFWRGPNGFTATGVTVDYMSLQTSGASVFEAVAVQNGCTSAAQYFTVEHNAVPQLDAFTGQDWLCQGENLHFGVEATGAASYLWRGPNGFLTTTAQPALDISNVSPSMSGVYQVWGIQGACTSAFLEKNVRVVRAPSKPELQSVERVCQGQSLTLTAISLEAGAVYFWEGPSGFSVTTADFQQTIPSVALEQSGKYTAQVIAHGCTSAKAETWVQVIPLPSQVQTTANSPICLGSPLQFQFSNTQNARIEIQSPNQQTYYTQNASISWVPQSLQESGIYRARAILNGCASSWDSINVWIFAAPQLDSVRYTSKICSGAPAYFEAFITPPAAYIEWKGAGALFATGPIWQTSALTQSMTVSMSFTVAGCGVQEKTLPVIVTPKPLRPLVPASVQGCQGEPLILQAPILPAGSSYQWLTPGGIYLYGEKLTLAPLSSQNAGVYSVVAIEEGCTSAPATVEVNVFQKPDAPSLSGNSPICAGQTLLLSGSTLNNTPIFWVGPNNALYQGETLQIPNITSSATGFYSAYTVANGCTSETAVTNVNLLPAPAAPIINLTAQRVCQGSAIRISTNPAANTQYLFSGPAGFSSTQSSSTLSNLSPAASGVYSLVSVVNGCTSQTATATLTVIPIPQITLANPVVSLCAGQNLQLTASSDIQGVAWQWIGPINATTATLSRTNATAQHSGVYTVVAMVNGCTSRPAMAQVNIHPVPAPPLITHNAPLCSGATLRLATNAVADNYLWSGPLGFQSTQRTLSIDSVPVTASGIYSLQIVAGPCTSAVATANIVIRTAPEVTSLISNEPVCEGGVLELSVNASLLGVTYQWSGPHYFSSTLAQPKITNVTAAHAGEYSVTIIYGGCASSSSKIRVNVLPRLSAPLSIQSNAPLCLEDTLRLWSSLAPNFNFSWTGPNNFSSTLPMVSIPNVTPANSGVYSLVVEGGACGSLQSSLAVVINQAPQVAISAPITACAGDNVQLSATLLPNVRYQWSGPGGFTTTGALVTLPNVGGGASGVYRLQVTEGRCSTTIAHSLFVNNRPPAPLLSSNSPICRGQILALSAHSLHPVFWYGPNGFSSNEPQVELPNAQLQSAGVYLAQAYANGCTSSAASIRVQVVASPLISSLESNAPICQGQTLILTGNATGASAMFWQGPGGLWQSGSSWAFRAAAGQEGLYTFSAIASGCTVTATLPIQIAPTPSAPVVVAPSSVCLGQMFALNANSPNAAAYYWQGPAGFAATGQEIMFTANSLEQGGAYSVWAIAGHCTSLSASTHIEILPSATPQIMGRATVCENQTLHLFVANPVSGQRYRWQTPNNQIIEGSNLLIPNARQEQSGIYSLVAEPSQCSGGPILQTVSVLAAPQATIQSNAPVCEGASLWLKATPVEQGSSYRYYSPDGGVYEGAEIEISEAEPSHTGTWLLKVEKGLCQAEFSAKIAVTQVPKISVSSNSPVCEGSLLSLSATGVSDGQYLWQGPGGYISAEKNPSFIAYPENSGVYTFTAYWSNCLIGPLTVSVSVDALPTGIAANNNGPICSGASLELSVTALPGASYYWTGPNGFTATTVSPIIRQATTQNSGVYSVLARVGRCVAPVAVTSASVTDCSVGCLAPQRLSLENMSSGSALLTWEHIGANTQCYIITYGPLNVEEQFWSQFLTPYPTQSFQLTGLEPGISYGARIVSNCSACSPRLGEKSAPSQLVSFTTLPSRIIAPMVASDLQVYPNPSNGIFVLMLPYREENIRLSIELYDVQGKRVYAKDFFVEASAEAQTIEAAHIPPGVYVLQAYIAEKMLITKIIKN